MRSAHRIGQTRPVTVYRLITKDTAEERVVHRAQKKLFLDTMVTGAQNRSKIDEMMSDQESFNTEELLKGARARRVCRSQFPALSLTISLVSSPPPSAQVWRQQDDQHGLARQS